MSRLRPRPRRPRISSDALTRTVAGQAGQSLDATRAVLDALSAVVHITARAPERPLVEVPGFGLFYLSERRANPYTCPWTGERGIVPPSERLVLRSVTRKKGR